MDLSVATVGDVLTALGGFDSNSWAVNGSGQITVSGSNAAGSLTDVTGTALEALGLTSGTYTLPDTFNAVRIGGGTGAITGSSLVSELTSSPITSSDTLTVDGATISFAGSGANSITSTGATLNASTATVQNVLDAIDAISGGSAAISGSGAITVNGTSTTALTLTGSALSKLGLTATAGNSASVTVAPVGQTLSFDSIGGGMATTVTFGAGSGQVSTLNQLNTQLAADDLQATLDASGALTVTTTNDAASATIGTLGGSATSTGGAFHGVPAATAPVADPNSQATRASLVAQYNNVLAQINATALDASFNGVNLLNGDTLKLVFNETGQSTLSITGVTLNTTGLGLGTLASGTDFLDNNSANKALTALGNASTTLRSEASTLGSNLSIVQVRQDFNKNLINVLQTGASNLTLADINEEAANSQALSTRQSIAVSALALANQSQASVLQLLR